MSKTLKEKVIVTEDEGENVASQESASSIDEGPTNPRRRGSTDCGGYVASVSSGAEIQEGDTGASISPTQRKVNLLDKTRILKNRLLKKEQYDLLNKYFMEMVRPNNTLYWYRWFNEMSSNKLQMIDDMPCECDLEEEYKISENTEEGCKKEEEKPTKQESSPIQQLVDHNNTCKAKRLSLHFSCIAEYFIEEEVDADMFLYIPFPKNKLVQLNLKQTKPKKYRAVDNEYSILQENRRTLIFKLKKGLLIKLLSWCDMNKNNHSRYVEGKIFITDVNYALHNFLVELVKPYEKYLDKKENNEDGAEYSNQNQSNETDDLVDDTSRYLLLKAEFPSLETPLEGEGSEIYHEEVFDDAADGADYISYEECLESRKSEENKPATSNDKNEELDIEKKIKTEHATEATESKRQMADSEQETEL